MKKITTLSLAVLLTGCTSLDGFKDEHSLLYQANKAELRMSAAEAKQAAGTALIAAGTIEYLEAKGERDNALEELANLVAPSS